MLRANADSNALAMQQECKQNYTKSSSSSQPNEAYIDGSSSWTGFEVTAGWASLTGMLKGLMDVAATVVCRKLVEVGGELPIALSGDSKTCDADLFAEATCDLEGVAKIVLRAAPDSKAFMVGAFDGVSATLWCARFRAVALRCTVPGTMGCW